MKYFKKENGKITTGKARMRNELKGLKDGEYGFEVKEWKDSRTLRQNRMYWKWITILADHHGYDKNAMHEVFLEMFAPVMTIEGLDGKPIQKKVRSSKMTVNMMSNYMSNIDRHAAEFDVQLPRPEEEMFSQGHIP